MEFIHFDSINSIQTTQNDPYDVILKLNNTITNIDKIYLKSLEMPILFDNVRDNINVFTISCSTGTFSVTLTPKTYSSINTLISDLNTAFTGVIANATVTFSLVSNERVRLTLTSSTVTNVSVVDTNLSKYILGFKKVTTSVSGNDKIVTAGVDYVLNIDNYIVLSITDFNSVRNSGNYEYTFKIPLNATTGVIYFQSENESFTQYVKVHNPNYNMHQLRIRVLDRFGNVIVGNNGDYSFTLAFSFHQT